MMRRNIADPHWNPRAAPQERRRQTMHTMNVSMWMEKVGVTLVSGLMMVGLPLAVVAIIVQSL